MQQATATAPAKKQVRSIKVDRAIISLASAEDVRYWTNALGMSEEHLRLLVRMHGTDVQPILAALNRNRAA